MQRLIDLTTVSARHRELFAVYLSDAAFRRYADDRLLAPHRISLATLAASRPDGFGDRAIGAKLYDMGVVRLFVSGRLWAEGGGLDQRLAAVPVTFRQTSNATSRAARC